MRRTLFPFVWLFVLASPAAAEGRCGTDDFGNVVCLGRDGAVNTMRPDIAGKDARGNAAPAGSADAGEKVGRDGKSARPRCGEDPFGNRVCR